MADNVTLPGTGAVVAADDVSSVYYQYMKLASSESASTDLIGDTDYGSTRALWVDKRIVALDTQLTSSGLTTATTAYSIGDALGTIFELTSAVRASGGSGMITGLSLLDEGDVLSTVDCYISKASISQTDNSAFAPSDSDARNIMYRVRFPPPEDLGGNRFVSLDSLGLQFYSSATSLWFTLVTQSANAVFAAASDIKLTVTGFKY